ncbi:DUF150 domain-containing protein [Cephalotus follicularis]|uniref:DUF150 domain-containing protein n=1 Tax=Cephalotus follicularis TaxID=3775 RepID=A0A1Q3ASU8_CEPFO|nr:DUF150 domain-containing protein [Cephalotus follicularis]
MDLFIPPNLKVPGISIPPSPRTTMSSFNKLSLSPHKFSISFWTYPFEKIASMSSCIVHAKNRRNSEIKPILITTIVEEVSMDDEDEEEGEEHQLLSDDFQDEALTDDEDGDYFEEDYMEDDAEVFVGDGGGGGGVSLAGTWWDKEALAIAQNVCLSFDGNLQIYAFRKLPNATLQVRIEKMSNKSGSPNMEDIEAFTATYRAQLDEAELAKSIPENISLEVSSPGVERVVRIPQELERFKDRPMYVKYMSEVAESGLSSEIDGVFRLISFDVDTRCCTWGLADVRINREKAGKGRPLNKKQREWRLDTTFDSLRLVRLYSGD